MVKMAQPWYMNIPLVDSHGNVGSIYGDPPASYRYTEARLTKFAEEVMLDNVKGSVDFIPNYDYSLQEPCILPCKVPLSLVNGSFGIAVGYAACIPPHNFSEVIAETMKLMKDPDYEVELLPDYPTGGILCNADEVKKAYKENLKNGRIILRSKIIKDKKKNTLTIVEIPYLEYLDKVKETIQTACTDQPDPKDKKHKIPRKIEGVADIEDNSTGGKIELIIKVKKDFDLDLIENQLYTYTDCQTTLNVNFVGVVDENFENYKHVKDILQEWIDFRIDTVKRVAITKIQEKNYRIHIIDGLLIVLDDKNIDKLIQIARNGKDKKSVMDELIKVFKVSEQQAEYIAMLRLYQINHFEISALDDEKSNIQNEIDDLMKYFTDRNKVIKYITDELVILEKKYRFNRRTEIQNLNLDNAKELIIPETDHTLIVTKKYIKKLADAIKIQKRGGKGNSIGKIKDDDTPISIFNVNNKDNILIFTDSGKVYSKKVYEIPICEIQSLGYNMNSILKDEKITNIFPINDAEMKNENIKIVIGTRQNKIKLVSISEFANIFQTGIIATRLNEGDTVIYAQKVDVTKNNSIIACTTDGTTINMRFKTIPDVLRPTFGSNIFDSSIITKDNVIAGIDLIMEDTPYVTFITKKGLGKKVEVGEFPEQIRSGKGRIGIRMKTKDDAVIKVIACPEDCNLSVISNTGVIGMSIKDVSTLLRPAYGNTIKKLNSREFIIDASIV